MYDAMSMGMMVGVLMDDSGKKVRGDDVVRVVVV